MTEKIKAAVDRPVLLTGGVQTPEEAEALLAAGKADLIGVGRALFRNARWGEGLFA
jgi:2,4-dienoyl-CoA reductase-like NADH-dependent reductase (Old Yellow Enzyme family)